MEQTTPYTLYAESTPNPATMKFVANRVLLETGLAEYTSMDEAKNSPLAFELFKFPFVTGVFIQDNFVTVMKSDMVPWEDVVMEIREFIREHLNKGGQIVKSSETTTSGSSATTSGQETHAVANSELEEKIIAILDQEIAPAVARDGGNITFKGYEKGVVNVMLRGACSGCPSSTVTLKNGIETLLKSRLPGEVDEVIAING